MPRRINNSFVGGKIVNCRGVENVNIDGMGLVTFRIDKNLSVYEVTPRKFSIGNEEHDVLSVVYGQVPNAAKRSLETNVAKWYADAQRYAS